MTQKLEPIPNETTGDRRYKAETVRDKATNIRKAIKTPSHVDNGEYVLYAPASPTTFTKGLPHDDYGIVLEGALNPFVEFISQTGQTGFGYTDAAGASVPIGPIGGQKNYHDEKLKKQTKNKAVRTWESPLAGHVYDLEGPDANRVTIPEAPKLKSGELAAEMAEVYSLALLRDFPFSRIETGGESLTPQSGIPKLSGDVIAAMKQVSWFNDGDAHTDDNADQRRKARLNGTEGLTNRTAFRGSTPGAMAGPYLSQFMLIGNASRGGSDDQGAIGTTHQNYCAAIGDDGEPRRTIDGYILYGTQEIDQRGISHEIGKDYLTDWASWIDAQNGANFKNRDGYEKSGRRFIMTPRDLGTYVHFDQLYQAYLNACILMLGYGMPFDGGLPEGGSSANAANKEKRDAFATFGGPHILSLVTEVASRALKFARRQKFNIHLRARPEAVAGVLTLAASEHRDKLGKATDDAKTMAKILGMGDDGTPEAGSLLEMIVARNKAVNAAATDPKMGWIDPHQNYLLPMAFPEGSPMHPSYAAGHATVAGACVTILKAFFEMFETQDGWDEKPFTSLYDQIDDKSMIDKDNGLMSGLFQPEEIARPSKDNPHKLVQLSGKPDPQVTLMGELDKLAANISIGRDMAGVHYYTDYYESLRMGERVAVGILQEQMLTYPEEVTMRLKTFDSQRMTIKGHGDGETATVTVESEDGSQIDFDQWFTDDVPPSPLS